MTRRCSQHLNAVALASLVVGCWLMPSLVGIHAAHAQDNTANLCGNPFVNHFGPWDYRSTRKQDLEIVERIHFTPGIETMTRPGTTMMHDMAQDVAYTLGVFPNHHRALITMQRLSEKHKADPPPGTNRSVECWFDRAIRFRPDDTVVRALFAMFLNKQNRKADALNQLDVAVGHAKDNPFSHYNLGLMYLELGEHDKALAQAHRAMALGMSRTELADQLKRAGKWVEPASVGTTPP